MSELYTKYEFEGIEYYKCNDCKFYTKFLSSLKRHNKNGKCKLSDKLKCEYCNKEFNYPIDIQRHLNRKKKCYVECKTIIDKQIKTKDVENIIELKKQIEELSEDNKSLNEKIISKDSEIKLLETQYIENKIFMYNECSNLLLESSKNKIFENDLEYYLLFNAITEYRDIADTEEKLKEKLYLTMSYMKKERYYDFFNKVKKDYPYLIQHIVDYYKYLKTIDDKKINGKNRESFISDIGLKIQVYFEIDL